ncbi:hypothetical protein G3N95_36955 [Paraburkholderia sp. Tr-20389]|uniref:hypothetical protein n=1 Tax=Paraburkholderia sp. Tr-20389 TaxID=2703903 RepID=UPI00197EBC1C|nr:hypothetical protein [Paraburkholderia sp. Tr-20389]MBN3758549.1 hypothetical protein [Paraburkholderia sp. Tr-20389]
MQLPDAAIGSIIAAAIAGLVVFISTVLTKEQKTSEFRQTWIDEIRKDISQFISGTTEVVALYSAKKNNQDSQVKFLEDNFKLLHELQSIEHRILLRLNPREHSHLIQQVASFRSNVLNAYNGSGTKAEEQRLTGELMESTKVVLKSEWERVKKGEPAFRIVKVVALSAIAVLLVFLARSFVTPPSPAQEAAAVPSPTSGAAQIVIQNYAEISYPATQPSASKSGKRHAQRLTERAPVPASSCEGLKSH